MSEHNHHSKTLGELTGKWAIIFKITQILWAILLPILLAVMVKWGPWVTQSTVLNNEFRTTHPQLTQQALTQVKAELMIWHHQDLTAILKELREDQKSIIRELGDMKRMLPGRSVAPKP